mgnify:CR=1 FL=1
MLTKISKGYQVTIPAKIRHEFGLDIGTTIDVEGREKEIVIKPLGMTSRNELLKLFKEARKYKHRLTPEQLDEMEEAIYN